MVGKTSAAADGVSASTAAEVSSAAVGWEAAAASEAGGWEALAAAGTAARLTGARCSCRGPCGRCLRRR